MGFYELIVIVGALAGGFVLGLTGFGNGPTAFGFWLHVLTPQLAAPLAAFGSVLGHIVMFGSFRHAMSKQRIMPIVAGGLAGVPVGVWLLTFLSSDTFRLFAGLLLTAYCVVSLAGGLRFKIADKTPLRDGFIGWLGGICGGLASLSGPIVTIWCTLKGWTPDEQRGTYQPFNFAILLAALVGFGIAGLFTAELATVIAMSLPATLVGVWFGKRCYGYLDAVLFRRIVLILLAASGLALVTKSL